MDNFLYCRLPENEALAKEWLDILDLPSELVQTPDNIRICSNHFLRADFRLKGINPMNNVLMPGVVPSVFHLQVKEPALSTLGSQLILLPPSTVIKPLPVDQVLPKIASITYGSETPAQADISALPPVLPLSLNSTYLSRFKAPVESEEDRISQINKIMMFQRKNRNLKLTPISNPSDLSIHNGNPSDLSIPDEVKIPVRQQKLLNPRVTREPEGRGAKFVTVTDYNTLLDENFQLSNNTNYVMSGLVVYFIRKTFETLKRKSMNHQADKYSYKNKLTQRDETINKMMAEIVNLKSINK